NIYNNRIKCYKCNLLDLKEQENLICKIKPTHLLHLAWYTNPSDYLTSLKNIKWFKASLNLLHKFELYGGYRAVFAGTCIENTESPYAICKTNLRDSLNIIYENSYSSYVWGRIFYPYGIYENIKRLIPYTITSLLQNKETFFTKGEQIRDFMYVKDISNAFVKILDSNVEGEIDISSGESIKLSNVIELIGKKLDKLHLIHLGKMKYRENEIMEIKGCPERLKKEFEWSPEYSLNKGLDETIKWWRSELQK
ncbi:NAD-dependent epimerase/dehydratase family protein, partial [Patescibacteria group bacterium]|nr:NAD-dependent epimerase/dehydratase family protein [Patescibacteria group bacterium]